ncbi:hypothetical protein ACU6TU_17010 [Halomonas sp. LS-001]
MEPNNHKNKSRSAIKAKNIALILAATLFAAAVSVTVNASQGDDIEGQIIQYSQSADNVSIIQQIGNYNKAQVIQSHSELGNIADIYQNGNNNQASIHQSNDNNIGIIFQEGNKHNAEITQIGGYEGKKVTIEQFGFGSDISFTQLELGSGPDSISIKQDNPPGFTRSLSITAGQYSFTSQSQ